MFHHYKCIIFYQVLNMGVTPEDGSCQLPKHIRGDSVLLCMF